MGNLWPKDQERPCWYLQLQPESTHTWKLTSQPCAVLRKLGCEERQYMQIILHMLFLAPSPWVLEKCKSDGQQGISGYKKRNVQYAGCNVCKCAHTHGGEWEEVWRQCGGKVCVRESEQRGRIVYMCAYLCLRGEIQGKTAWWVDGWQVVHFFWPHHHTSPGLLHITLMTYPTCE